MSHMPAGFLKGDDETLNNVIQTNPLYKFRKANNQSLRSAAIYIGVSHGAADNWEKGLAYPTDENFLKMANWMEVDVADLHRRWSNWRNQSQKILKAA